MKITNASKVNVSCSTTSTVILSFGNCTTKGLTVLKVKAKHLKLDNNMVIVVLAYCWHIDYLTIFNIAALACCCSTITSLLLHSGPTINDYSHTYKNGLMHTWKKWGKFVNNNILISPAICWPRAGAPLINNSLSSGNTSLCYVMQLVYVQTLLIKKHYCYDSKNITVLKLYEKS